MNAPRLVLRSWRVDAGWCAFARASSAPGRAVVVAAGTRAAAVTRALELVSGERLPPVHPAAPTEGVTP